MEQEDLLLAIAGDLGVGVDRLGTLHMDKGARIGRDKQTVTVLLNDEECSLAPGSAAASGL